METARCNQDSLIREAQAGSHAAFSQLVHAHDEAVLTARGVSPGT